MDSATQTRNKEISPLLPGLTYLGDSRKVMKRIKDESVDLSIWSPPYFVGKNYESYLDFEGWKELLRTVIKEHTRVLKPGSFLAINIADILAFPDESIPRFQADVVSTKRSGITREMVLQAQSDNPHMNRYQLAKLLGCSEQTIHRRIANNNVRGGKYQAQTRVKTVGGMLEEFGQEAGLPLYDRRIWVKDPTWANSRWHSSSYRAVDEFEYIYIFWKPGITKVDRNRLNKNEWSEWGSRAVWNFRSVRSNHDHEAKFPLELPLRLIRMLTEPDGLILDPFMGSGTTGVAAIQTGREFIGIEKEQKYVEMANFNCEHAASVQTLF